MATYEIWLCNDVGMRIKLLSDFLGLSATHVANQVGAFSLSLPTYFDTSLLTVDKQVQVWRAPTCGVLRLFRAYFVRQWEFATQNSQQTITIGGPDVNDIISRRIVGYFSQSAETAKAATAADNLMKAIVRENFTTGADYSGTVAARNLSTYFSVDADWTLGPTLSRRISWGNVLGIVQDLSKASREQANEVFFDVQHNVISDAYTSYIFRTFINQPGAARGAGSVIQTVFDQERGNLRDPSLSFDWNDEINVAYGAGQGEASNRIIQKAEDTTRSGASFWARREGYAEARMEESDAGVLAVARAMVRDRQPRRTFEGIPVDSPGTRFGIDWDWGDTVTARYRGYEFDCIIRAVRITATPSGERIEARLEYDV